MSKPEQSTLGGDFDNVRFNPGHDFLRQVNELRTQLEENANQAFSDSANTKSVRLELGDNQFGALTGTSKKRRDLMRQRGLLEIHQPMPDGGWQITLTSQTNISGQKEVSQAVINYLSDLIHLQANPPVMDEELVERQRVLLSIWDKIPEAGQRELRNKGYSPDEWNFTSM